MRRRKVAPAEGFGGASGGVSSLLGDLLGHGGAVGSDIDVEWDSILKGHQSDALADGDTHRQSRIRTPEVVPRDVSNSPLTIPTKAPLGGLPQQRISDAGVSLMQRQNQAMQSAPYGESNMHKVRVSSLNSDEIASISSGMRELFAEIKVQISAYKQQYDKLIVAARNAEVLKTDLEIKIEELEEDNAQLQTALAKGLGSKGAQQKANVNRGKSKADQLALAADNQGSDIRKALLMQDEGGLLENEDEFNGLTGFKKLRKSIALWIELHTPFEKENRKIHSTFGGAVAAYFLFARWM
jgi:hypothetical protein